MCETQPLDIFFFGNLLEEKFPEYLKRVDDEAVTAVSIAIPGILAESRRIVSEVLPELAKVPPADMDELEDELTSLQEVLLHMKGHLEEADNALWKLIDACTAQKP